MGKYIPIEYAKGYTKVHSWEFCLFMYNISKI